MLVEKNHFFDNYPEVFAHCLNVIEEVDSLFQNEELISREISFDLILPFLFENIALEKAKEISKVLRLYREVVDRYNRNNVDVARITQKLTFFDGALQPITYLQYKYINENARKLRNENLAEAYMLSTERVYYRFEILNKLNIPNKEKNDIIESVKTFSAFLLFDDDVCDLTKDILNKKNTILVQYLSKGNSIERGIDIMGALVKDDDTRFGQFTRQFKNVYKL